MLQKSTVTEKKTKIFFGFVNSEIIKKKEQGGFIKIKTLTKYFKNEEHDWNILYFVSSALPDDWPILLLIAKIKGAKIVLNQNGVAYPAWHGWGWRITNIPLKLILKNSNTVLYQSIFCKKTSEKFLGQTKTEFKICYNPVKIQKKRILKGKISGKWKILLGGNQYQKYRLEQAIDILAQARNRGIDATLTVLGDLNWKLDSSKCLKEAKKWCKIKKITNQVKFYGRYSQLQMPKIFKNHHILLHTKINDPCPTTVLEGLAAGLPVLYSNSGGLPEIVGTKAGVGVIRQNNWFFEKKDNCSDYVDGLQKIIKNYNYYNNNAYKRALRFSEIKWINFHKTILK